MKSNKFLVMGKKHINRDEWNNISNHCINKPIGGLWSSTYKEGEGFKSDWHEWCYYEMPHWINQYGVLITLKEDTRVYTINTYEDLKSLCDNYEFKTEFSNMFRQLDFESISKDYDSIHLTEEGQMNTRFSIGVSLYGWDVETMLILNYDCIDKQEYIEFDKEEMFVEEID